MTSAKAIAKLFQQGDGSGDENTIGLIDIGSNSIRLVIYRAGGRLPHPQFNEREVCRLGEGLSETGRLAPDRIAHALEALERFAQIIKASDIDALKIFATEAVRKAQNARDFLVPAEAILQTQIRILSGEEEAQFAGKGVLSGFVDVDGIVGDLGGGSLELIHVKNLASIQNQPQISLACGHLNPMPYERIKSMLKDQGWIAKKKGKPFYAVGGTWRAIATAHTATSKRRLHIVHGLTLPKNDLQKLLEKIEKSDGEIEGIPMARRASMTQASTVMRALLDVMQPSEVVFSSYGVREGLLYDDLSNDIRRIDPLVAGVFEFSTMTERHAGLGLALSSCLLPFIQNLDERLIRLSLSCCYLADMAWLDHPDYRASLAVEKMLGLSVVGIDHSDRAWMAAVLSTRYSGSFPSRSLFRGLLSKKERRAARLVGLSMRMLMTVTGGIPSLLDSISVSSHKRNVQIDIPERLHGHDQGLINRRIDAISSETGLKINTRFI